MFTRGHRPKWILSGVLVSMVVGAICWRWAGPLAPVVAAPPPPATPVQTPAPAAAPAAPAPSAAYSQWVVAYMHGNVAITREMLGEYLIARMGADWLDNLINVKIIEHECRERGIAVTAAEVEKQYREDYEGFKLTRKEFESRVLKHYRKTPYEYKEDVIRPNLLMAKLCQARVQVTDDDLRKAYLSQFGEKVDCQIIYWSKEKEKDARAAYDLIRANAEEFDRVATKQEIPNLAAVGGKIPPFGRFSDDNPELEEAAFRLQPGEISGLIQGKEGGLVVVKCLNRLPSQNKPFEEVRDTLAQVVSARKLQEATTALHKEFHKRANPLRILKKDQETHGLAPEVQLVHALTPAAGQTVPATQPSADYAQRVVAYLYGNVPITREMLGEYLIARFGVERLDKMIAKMVIEYEARSRNLEVTPEEVEVSLQQTLREENLTLPEFTERARREHRATLYEWKEDVIRSRLLLTKLLHGRVAASEEEVRMAYEAHHGEKVACQIILWPREEEKRVMMLYTTIRDNPQEFDRAASTQASATLASAKGRVADMGRYSTGNPELEKTAFSLQPGEVSRVIGVPEGLLVLKCLGRVPAKNTPLEEVRAALEREVIERKTVLEIPRFAAELQKTAKVVKILKNYEDNSQVIRDVQQEIEEVSKDGKPKGSK